MVLKMKQFAEKHFSFLVAPVRAMRARIMSQISKVHVRKLLREGKELKIEVGSGNRKGDNGWITVDMCSETDIFWDLRYGLPFPDASLSKIYSSHFLEHLSFQEGQAFFDECMRALKPNGVISICVPNAQIYLEAYVNRKELEKDAFFLYAPAYNDTTRMDYVNYTAYMDGQHKYMFDQENLLFLLSAKGFKDARLRDFDPEIDRQARDYESIYAEARR